MKKIVVFGSSNMDMVVNVEQMPKKGETVKSLAFDMIPGGKGANQACACGKLGGRCVFLSVVGEDENGTRLLQSLKASGVDTGHILISKTAPTGMALITVDLTGENSIVVVPGANKECGFDYYCCVKSEIESSDIVLAQLETLESVVYRLLSDAHDLGKTKDKIDAGTNYIASVMQLPASMAEETIDMINGYVNEEKSIYNVGLLCDLHGSINIRGICHKLCRFKSYIQNRSFDDSE